jgi:serine protease DegQ
MSRRLISLVIPVALAAIVSSALVGCADSDGTAPPTAEVGAATASPAASGAAPATSAGSSPAAASGSGGSGSGGQPGGGVAGDAGWAEIPAIVAEVQPSVVSIRREGGEGSGVIYGEDGIVVTNQHVVQGVDEALVVFADGTREAGRVRATDPLSDLAIVELERDGLPAAEFAAELPRVGSLAIAMGNPLGFENSVTAGIVSGVHRAVPGAAQQAPSLVDLIQTDAAISPGNSGGALVGGDGRVIGVNVAYIPPQAGSVSIGFAIPAPTVVDVVEQLLEDGQADHTWLGVQYAPLTPQIAQRFGIDRETGVLVVEVVPGGPAADAGVEPGDVIVGVGDVTVETAEDLLSALRPLDVGQQAPIRVVRGSEERELEVTLGAFPTQP